MSTANTDEVNLTAVAVGGQIFEDVYNRLYDLSPEDRPVANMCGVDSSGNNLKEFVEKKLAAANPRNAAVDGADAGTDESRQGKRKGNYHQIMTKTIRFSDRARAVDTIGANDYLVLAVTDAIRELKRDEEAAITSDYAANPGDGDTVPGELAGMGCWIGTTIAADSADLDGSANNRFSVASAGGTGPALSDAVNGGGYPDTAPVAGTAGALTETVFKSALRAAYLNGGNVRYAVGTPTVIEILSDYLFTSSARVAAMQTNVPQGNRTGVAGGDGSAGGGLTAQAAVNVYVGSYATVILTPDRFMPFAIDATPDPVDANSSLFLVDPDLWRLSYLQGYRTKPLGDTGLSSNRLMSVDVTLCALAERGNAVIANIDETAPMVA